MFATCSYKLSIYLYMWLYETGILQIRITELPLLVIAQC